MFFSVSMSALLNLSASCWARCSTDRGFLSSSIAACRIMTISELSDRPFCSALAVSASFSFSGILTPYGAMLRMPFIFLHRVIFLHSVEKKNLTEYSHRVYIMTTPCYEEGKMKGMRNIAPTGIRIPQEIKDALKERAAREGRSLNSEIIRILSASVKG